MNVTTVKARIATIQSGITGIKKVFTQIPPRINRAELPAFVNFIGPAQYKRGGYGTQEASRTFLMRLLIAPPPQGAAGENEAAAEPFFERVMTAFNDAPTLNGLAVLVWLRGDNGTEVIEIGGAELLSVEFQLEVEDNL